MTNYHSRRLPHYEAVAHPVFLTWRLHGSSPAGRAFPESLTSGAVFVAMDNLLHHARVGPMYLQQPEIAAMVCEALRHRETALKHCELHAWVVMPNHVHVLLTPMVPLGRLTQSLKRFTGLEANRLLSRSGAFWQNESYDRVVRDGKEFGRIAAYIEMNPVKAGLVAEPGVFPWSSASWSKSD